MAAILNRLGWLGVGIGVTAGLANSVLYNVDGGHRAVIFDQFSGVSNEVTTRPHGSHLAAILYASCTPPDICPSPSPQFRGLGIRCMVCLSHLLPSYMCTVATSIQPCACSSPPLPL